MHCNELIDKLGAASRVPPSHEVADVTKAGRRTDLSSAVSVGTSAESSAARRSNAPTVAPPAMKRTAGPNAPPRMYIPAKYNSRSELAYSVGPDAAPPDFNLIPDGRT